MKSPIRLLPAKPGGDPQNDRDLALLRDDPQALAVEYQGAIRMVVVTYVSRGLFRRPDIEELVQSVTERFLKAIPRIARHFSGSSLVRSYIFAVLRNICLELYRETTFGPRRHIPPVDPKEGPEDLSARPDARTYINHEVETLAAILAQFGRKRPKLELLLKIRYRIPISRDEILAWYPACPGPDVEMLLGGLGAVTSKKSDKELHTILLPVMSKAEGKAQTEEGIRRWTLDQIEEIIGLLNGSPPVSAFTGETLGLLLYEYFFRFRS